MQAIMMSIVIDSSKVCQSIAAMLRANYQHDEHTHSFRLRSNGDGEGELIGYFTDEWFTDVESRFKGNVQSLGDAAIGSLLFYETFVSEESRFGMSTYNYRESKSIELVDHENGYTYRLGPPSEDFLVFFLNRLADIAPRAAIRSSAAGHRIRRFLEEKTGENDLMKLVRIAFPRLLTCRVESKIKHTTDQLSERANSFLFSITYNTNNALVEMRTLDEFIRNVRFVNMQRSSLKDLDPPKRLYIRDLTYHYQLGVSAESPVLEFLSFYHVAEHFFEDVFQEDLINVIQERITRPDFSSKRKRDVQSLVKEINKRQKTRDDAITFSEQEALRLTLEKYVSLDSLRTKLTNYDVNLIAYFRDNKVSFSSGDIVDVDSNDTKVLFANLSKRIYKTRNAVVHSKDGEKSRFIPFKDDDALAKEIPLIRFIAEEIIISSSPSL